MLITFAIERLKSDQERRRKVDLPSKWLAWLKVGSRFNVNVDKLGRGYRARVVRLGARIDPVSQSISLVAQVNGENPELLPGMSGWRRLRVRSNTTEH
ncbi:MAG: HlyD family secretion protein [Gammaproteobacteria bacterium]|nr:HlyD family secretion protein [Gammaproteobacteria bacterium]